MASIRWVKILAIFSAIISGWSFIGGLLFIFAFSTVALRMYMGYFGAIPMIFVFPFLLIANVVLAPFVKFFPIEVLFYALVFVLLIIFVGSIYLLRKK